MKFLDSNGVAILWSKIKDYVAKTVEGDYLPLSGGDMTGTIESTAETVIRGTGVQLHQNSLSFGTNDSIISMGSAGSRINLDASEGISLASGLGIKLISGGSNSTVWNTNGTTTSLSSYATQSWANGKFLPLSGGYMNNNSSISIASADADEDGDRYGTRIDSSGVFIGNFSDSNDTHIEISNKGITSSVNDPDSTFTTDGGTSEFVKSIFRSFKKYNYYSTDQINVHIADNSGEIHIEYGQLDPDPNTFKTFVKGGIYWHAHQGGTGLDFYSNSSQQTSSNVQAVLNVLPNRIAFAISTGVSPGIVAGVNSDDIDFYITGTGCYFIDTNPSNNIDDSWVSDHISDIFDISISDVTPHSPHIIDMDRTNRCMLVRFEVEDTESQVYTISINDSASTVITAVPSGSGGDYKAMFVVPVYYDSDGSANMSRKYVVNWS